MATTSDRAFRSLARAEPEIIVALLRAVAPDVLPSDASVTVEQVEDSRLEAGPSLLDADWLARVASWEIYHLECQGYRDTTFPSRLFRYHIAAVLRFPGRRVRTFALWLIEPPPAQSVDVIVEGGVRLAITSIVLPRVPVERLLQDPRTACFALGADVEEAEAEKLCREVTRSLKESGASVEQWRMAVVLAAMTGRYVMMTSAMREQNLEPVIIEDLVKFGEDRGFERGHAAGWAVGLDRGRFEGLDQGRLEGLRSTLHDILDARGIALRPGDRTEIASQLSVERLRVWSRRAATASSAADVFLDA